MYKVMCQSFVRTYSHVKREDKEIAKCLRQIPRGEGQSLEECLRQPPFDMETSLEILTDKSPKDIMHACQSIREEYDWSDVQVTEDLSLDEPIIKERVTRTATQHSAHIELTEHRSETVEEEEHRHHNGDVHRRKRTKTEHTKHARVCFGKKKHYDLKEKIEMLQLLAQMLGELFMRQKQVRECLCKSLDRLAPFMACPASLWLPEEASDTSV